MIDDAALERAFERALMLRRFDGRAMRDVLDRSNGRRGVAHLRCLLDQFDDTPPRTKSDLERDFLAFCAAHDLPRPRTNVFIEDFEVDAHFPGTRLIVELDARSTHTTPRTFERDRERDRRLAVAGYVVVRVTDLQMTSDPDGLAADLRALGVEPAELAAGDVEHLAVDVVGPG